MQMQCNLAWEQFQRQQQKRKKHFNVHTHIHKLKEEDGGKHDVYLLDYMDE